MAQTYGANVLAVVLTGMGSDGTRGSAVIREAGGEVIVQDEASSGVWGMPGSVVAASLADRIYPLAGIGPEVVRRVSVRRASTTRDTRGTLRRNYFKDIGDKKLQASDLLKAHIRFDRVNLSDDSKMLFQKGLDIIFCCNVLIYFDLVSKRRGVQHFYSSLLPGDYLFLGQTESLFQVDDSFRLVHFPGTTAYWKPTAARAGGALK